MGSGGETPTRQGRQPVDGDHGTVTVLDGDRDPGPAQSGGDDVTGRPRRHPSWGDDVDLGELDVFIPGALASGFLVSLFLLAGDALRSVRGDSGARRLIDVTATAIVADVRCGPGAHRRISTGLRERWVYGLVGAASLGVAAIVIPGATWNFLNPDGYIRQVAWVAALSALGALAFLALGVQTMRVAPKWLPPFFAVAGTAFTLRYVLLASRSTMPLVAVAGSIVTVALVAGSWRLRGPGAEVPAAVRALAARSPLGRLPGGRNE